jgi:TM2 domain-containing membrane protein YozV
MGAAMPPTSASPVLAAFLGLIPGVGAMYNGQFAKAVAHLAIFVVLKLLEDASSVFGVFVFAWILYQVFDAYHTAKARMEGLPLPNPFGLNDIGERMGFGRNWPNAGSGSWGASRPAASAWQPTAAQGAPPAYGPVPPGSVPPTPVPPVSGPDWVGYVPPTHFAGYPPPPPTSPYTPPGHGAPYTPVAAPVAIPVPDIAPGQRPMPVGALWLIGLGALILVANLLPNWGMSEHWLPPVLFAGLGVYVLLRRLRRGSNLLYALRAPAVLFTLAIFGALHAAEIRFNPGLFVAVLFIVIGALLLLERTAGTAYVPVATPVQRASFVPAAEPHTPPYPAPPPAAAPEDETR